MPTRLLLVAAVLLALGVVAWATLGSHDAVVAPPKEPSGPPPERVPVKVAAPLSPPEPLRPPPALKGLAQPVVQPFQPTSPAEDFTTPMPLGHEPEAVRKLGGELETWLRAPENQAAQPRYLGMDCRTPPCVMALQFQADRDSGFLDRAEKWLGTRAGGPGQLVSYTHRLDNREQRQWFFLNPHPPGTREHHEFSEAAIARIQAEQRTLPVYNPSADMTDLAPPPPASP